MIDTVHSMSDFRGSQLPTGFSLLRAHGGGTPHIGLIFGFAPRPSPPIKLRFCVYFAHILAPLKSYFDIQLTIDS